MRTSVALLVLALVTNVAAARPGDAPKKRDRARLDRAVTLVVELGLDDETSARLLPLLLTYEEERHGLLATNESLNQRLSRTTDSIVADKLLDESLVIQRDLLAVEAKFVGKLRQILPHDQAARARVIVMLREPLGPCDPFAAMHRCPRRLAGR